MTSSTRRRFLATTGLTTAAGVAAVASAGPAAAEDLSVPADAPGCMAAYVRDVSSGEVALLVEGHEVVVTDRALAIRLARAFAQARRQTRGL